MPRYYDNTRTSTYGKCPRKYYMRHQRHWVGIGIAVPLSFGLGWHSAMDIVWDNIHLELEQLATLALAAFERKWVESGLQLMESAAPEDIERWGYRNPGTAFDMLIEYILERRSFIEECEIIAVEKPFAVPITADDPDLFYIGRIDKVVRRNGRVLGIEHKTSSLYKKDGYFRSDFVDSFSPNNQIDGYFHALKMMYGDEAEMILVDAALVHKTVHDGFKFIPVKRATQHLEAWLWEINNRIADMDKDLDRLEYLQSGQRLHNDDDVCLRCFTKQTEECIGKYGHCSYLDICKMEPNPELITHIPDGFKVEEWNPFDVNKIASLGLDGE